MQKFPHVYKVTAKAAAEGDVDLSGENLEPISTATPIEFGGPGNRWSPETLLVGAVTDCFVLTFRAVAAASKLSWETLTCEAEGTLDRIDGKIKFTHFDISSVLAVPQDVTEERATSVLQKAESVCLITNSLSATTHLDTQVFIAKD